MRKTFIKRCAIMLAFFILLQGFTFVSAETVGEIDMQVPATASKNEVFKIVLKAKDISDLYSFQAYITFNADKVQVVDVKGLGSFADEHAIIDYKLDGNSISIVGTMKGELLSSHEDIAAVYFKSLQSSGEAEFVLDGKTCWAKQDADITGSLYTANKEVKAITSLITTGDGSAEGGIDNNVNENKMPDDIDKIIDKILENISNNIEQSIDSAIERLDGIFDLGDNLTAAQKEKAAQLTQIVVEKLLHLDFVENDMESAVIDLSSDKIINNIKEARSVWDKAKEKGLIKEGLMSARIIKKSGPVNIIMANNFFDELKAADINLSIEVSKLNLVIPNNVFIAEDNSTISLSVSPKIEEVIYRGNSSYKPYAAYELEVINQKAGKQEGFSKFNNNIELKIKAPSAYSWETMVLYVFNEEENNWEYLKQARWIKDENEFSINLNHFSKYALAERIKDFSDLSETYDEAKKAIKVLTTRHIIEGSDENRYNPKAGLTRAEMAKLMVETAQLEVNGYKGSFNDVTEDQWFAPYVEAAFKAGMIVGFGDGTFHPDELVTREQLAVAVCNMYLKTTGIKVEAADLFGDDQDISYWAKEKVYMMRGLGMVKGNGNNKFSPAQSINRADAAVLFYNYLTKIFN